MPLSSSTRWLPVALQGACSNLHFHWQYMNFPCLTFPAALGIGSLFNFSHLECAYFIVLNWSLWHLGVCWNASIAFSFNPEWRAMGWPLETLTKCGAVVLDLILQNLIDQGPKACGKLCEFTQLFKLCESQSPPLHNGNNLKFLTELL